MLRFSPLDAMIQGGIDPRTKLIERRRAMQEWDRLASEREMFRRLLPPCANSQLKYCRKYSYSSTLKARSASRQGQVIALCRVCKLWRDVAIGTHQLWNDLKLRDYDVLRCDVDKISRWLGRCGSLPRRLTFEDFRACSTDHATGSDCFMVKRMTVVKLLTQGPTLHVLYFQEITPDCFHELAKHMKEEKTQVVRPWDRLDSLTISLSLRHIEDPPTLDQMLLHLPPVRTFELRGLHESWKT